MSCRRQNIFRYDISARSSNKLQMSLKTELVLFLFGIVCSKNKSFGKRGKLCYHINMDINQHNRFKNATQKDKAKYMRLALKEAQKAALINEVPVGAVIVKDGKVIARGHNIKEQKKNSMYHAEIVALQKACKKIGDWRLNDCDIFVTLEPCPMCAGALINARIGNIFFGAYDDRAGCCGTLYDLPGDTRFNHRPNVEGGILQDKCGEILVEYFKQKRREIKEQKQKNKEDCQNS